MITPAQPDQSEAGFLRPLSRRAPANVPPPVPDAPGTVTSRLVWPWRCILPLAALLLGMGSVTGCSTPSRPPEPSRIHEIRIADHIRPSLLYVYVGEEVRWHNEREAPVTIGLLSPLTEAQVVCNTGFSRFGSLRDTVTVPPRQSVSLCFSQAGAVQYNVWLNPADLLHSMTPTATISVSSRPSSHF